MMKLLAGILMAVGILLMTGSGLCSLWVILGTGVMAFAWIALIVGGIPFGVGLCLFLLGRKIFKDQQRISLDELDDRFS